MEYLDELIAESAEGGTTYHYCPACRGTKKTLGITKEMGEVKFGCFRAGCTLRGMKLITPTKEQLLKRLSRRNSNSAQQWAVPPYFIAGLGCSESADLLAKNNCLDAYKEKLFRCMYDPRQERLVVLLPKNVGGVGRLVKHRKGEAKVLNYGNVSQPLIVGNSPTAILVEDMFSAIRVGYWGLTGVCLFGTNLKREYISYLKQYTKLIIALDRDARGKAIKMRQQLKDYFTDVEVQYLDEDIKNLENTPEWINNLAGELK